MRLEPSPINPIKTLRVMEKQSREFQEPVVTQYSANRDPYLVLISCMLSLRTKDETTRQASRRLFKTADTPEKMVKVPRARLEKIIYPVGFYRNKARAVLATSRAIIGNFHGKVPGNREDLLTLAGVGRKTANLVLGLGFGTPAICVDSHVHQIANRLGWIKTKDPFATELALEKILTPNLWIEVNNILVVFGQNICVPVSPFCSRCMARPLCKRVGVKRSR